MEPSDFNESEFIEALCTLHEGLPRGGPGSDAYTRRALRGLPGLPEPPRVLDVGCGPGKQTLVLAEELGVKITAVDFYQPFLDQLIADAHSRGLNHLVKAVNGDMGALDYPSASWDLIWSEGAIFIVGFEKGLTMWRPWLAPGGCVAVTESAWFKPDPPREAVEFWDEVYPDIKQIPENLSAIKRAGYKVIDHFVLDSSVWWESYFNPRSERIDELARAGTNDPAMEFVMAQSRREMETMRQYGGWYGYVFYLMQAV